MIITTTSFLPDVVVAGKWMTFGWKVVNRTSRLEAITLHVGVITSPPFVTRFFQGPKTAETPIPHDMRLKDITPKEPNSSTLGTMHTPPRGCAGQPCCSSWLGCAECAGTEESGPFAKA